MENAIHNAINATFNALKGDFASAVEAETGDKVNVSLVKYTFLLPQTRAANVTIYPEIYVEKRNGEPVKLEKLRCVKHWQHAIESAVNEAMTEKLLALPLP